MKAPYGTGFWIWYADHCEGGDFKAIARKCNDLGVAYVLVKTNDGEWDWSRRNHFADGAKILHDAGIGAGAWGYSVGDWQGTAIGFEGSSDVHDCTIAQELSLVENAFALGADFFVVDAEMEWGRRNKPSDHATRYIAEMRRRMGGAPIGFSNAPRANGGFGNYPIEAMTAPGSFDFWMPQVYVNEWKIPEQLSDWTKRGLGLITDTALPDKMNGLPTFCAYDTTDNAGNPADADFFTNAAAVSRDLGARGISYWTWDNCPQSIWANVPAVTRIFPAMEEVKAATAINKGLPLPYNVSPNPAVWLCEKTNIWVTEPRFLDRYTVEGDKALETFGLPIQGMIQTADGTLIQYFERARFELHTNGVFMMGRIGAELVDKG